MQMSSITVILNSGATLEEKIKLEELITRAFANAQCECSIVNIKGNEDIGRVCEDLVIKARAHNAIIVAAGGDGTVNTIAGLCYRHGVTMGVIPLGTFNYFARELLIPTTIDEAVTVIAGGWSRRVSIGLMQDRVFLNNASFGLYTKLIRQREQASSHFGRIRIIAAAAAVYSLFHRHKLFSVIISGLEGEETHYTPMVFVGNNTLQLENLGMELADCTKQDRLAVVVMQPMTRLETSALLLLGALGKLRYQSKLSAYCADDFEVTSRRKTIELVIDGEIITCQTPLKFRVEKHALSVVVPQPAAEE